MCVSKKICSHMPHWLTYLPEHTICKYYRTSSTIWPTCQPTLAARGRHVFRTCRRHVGRHVGRHVADIKYVCHFDPLADMPTSDIPS
jgi:hypothetical protein